MIDIIPLLMFYLLYKLIISLCSIVFMLWKVRRNVDDSFVKKYDDI